MQPQREAFKLKPGFSFSSSDTSNEEESVGPFKLRFGDATDEAPSIASLFGPRSKPAALPDKITPSPSSQTQLAAVEPQHGPQDAVVQPPSMALTPAPKSVIPAPALATPDEQMPKRSLGLVKALQLSAAPRSADSTPQLTSSQCAEVARDQAPRSARGRRAQPQEASGKGVGFVCSATRPAHRRPGHSDVKVRMHAHACLISRCSFDASDPKPAVDFPVAASALPAAAIVPAPVMVPVMAPPAPTPMAISVPAQAPDQGVAIEVAASMHEKRLEDCTIMAKRLEEILGSLGNYKERLSELLRTRTRLSAFTNPHLATVQQACLNAEILITNSPQLMDLARGSVGAEE